MQIDEYLLHYEQFLNEFDIDNTPQARREKLVIEMCEFLEADYDGKAEEADQEALDVMNVAISNVVARGIKNPLFSGYLKLQKTAEKYRGAKDIGNRTATP